MSPESIRVEAQQALDELRKEKLLPFPLAAYKLTDEGLGEYTVNFCDSRLHSVIVRWQEGQSFKAAVRAAVLARVDKIGGALKKASPLY